MARTHVLMGVGAAVMLVWLNGCGGDGVVLPPPVTPPPTPATTITAVGAGALVLHPSLDARFGFALETPIRVTETTGGTADWNFARISIFLSGTEIERFELGADVIRSLGYSRITANSNAVRSIVFRQNSQDFDQIDITLGFSDLKDARQFTVAVPFGSFTGVNLSLTPMFAPPGGAVGTGGQ